MLKFATYDDLRRIGKSDVQQILRKASETNDKTVFLSHSSDDHDFMPAVIAILENHGGKVYVDEKDPLTFNINVIETANRLREVIKICKKLVLFVTPNTKNSNWIPWELGLSDGKNGLKNIALFPSAERYYEQSWSEEEYLGLYQRIIWGNFENEQNLEWIVYNHKTNEGTKLECWLRS
jgi:TIR domain